MKRIARITILSLSALLLLAPLSTKRAHANVVVTALCNVSKVGWDGRLFVTCGSGSFVGYNGGTCAPQSPEVLRVMHSTFTTALLSQKPVTVTYEDGAGTGNAGCNGIYAVDLFN